jgi:hypothetical protein
LRAADTLLACLAQPLKTALEKLLLRLRLSTECLIAEFGCSPAKRIESLFGVTPEGEIVYASTTSAKSSDAGQVAACLGVSPV